MRQRRAALLCLRHAGRRLRPAGSVAPPGTRPRRIKLMRSGCRTNGIAWSLRRSATTPWCGTRRLSAHHLRDSLGAANTQNCTRSGKKSSVAARGICRQGHKRPSMSVARSATALFMFCSKGSGDSEIVPGSRGCQPPLPTQIPRLSGRNASGECPGRMPRTSSPGECLGRMPRTNASCRG